MRTMTARPPVASRPVIAAMLGSLGLVTAQAQVPMPAPIEFVPKPPGRPPRLRRPSTATRCKIATRNSKRSAPSTQDAGDRGQAQARDRIDRRRPAQAQPAALIDTAARVRSVEDRIVKTAGAPQAARRQRGRDCGNRWSSGAPSSPRCWRPCSASAGGRRRPSWSSPRMRCSRSASAIMLGAVLPEMRHEAESLATDLAELVRLRKRDRRGARPAGAATCGAGGRPPAPVAAGRRAPEAPVRRPKRRSPPSASALPISPARPTT